MPKLIVLLAVLILAAGYVVAAGSSIVVNFDDTPAESLPGGWEAGVTGHGTPKWAVMKAEDAPSRPNVFAQTGEGTYPYCVNKSASLENGFVEVKFKAISGKEDQAAGIVWRFQDGDNYYVTRANALEDNVIIYHTVNGKRGAFKNVNMKVAGGMWHTLRVDFKGSHFVVTFDGQKALDAYDTTFAGAGAVGVWTKADSVTYFDDFTYGPSEK